MQFLIFNLYTYFIYFFQYQANIPIKIDISTTFIIGKNNFFGLIFINLDTLIMPIINIKKLLANTVILAPATLNLGINIIFNIILNIRVIPMFLVFTFCLSQALRRAPMGKFKNKNGRARIMILKEEIDAKYSGLNKSIILSVITITPTVIGTEIIVK